MRIRHRIHILFAALATLFFGACSEPAPIDGFWGYPWGAPVDSILADSATIAFRLGGERFKLTRDSMRLRFDDVQYGLGYDRVELDFTAEGKLWHGRVRVLLPNQEIADSILTDLRKSFGREGSNHTFRGRSGTVSYWQTPDWLDRDFTARGLAPQLDPEGVRAIDLEVGGCIEECPLYSVRVTRTGEAYLWSIRHSGTEGGYIGTLPDSRFGPLAKKVSTPALLALADYYGYRGVNLKTRGFRADFGSFDRSSVSVEESGPPGLESLLKELEAATADITWRQIVDWDTVDLLDRPRIGLDSLEQLSRAVP